MGDLTVTLSTGGYTIFRGIADTDATLTEAGVLRIQVSETEVVAYSPNGWLDYSFIVTS